MAKILSPLSVVAPGALGLNTKSAGLDIGPQWCTNIRNGVVSDQGTLAARKGWIPFNGSDPISGEPDINVIHEYIDNSNNSRIIYVADKTIYEGLTTPTDVTGTITTPTADNWKFVNFNGKVIGVQADHKPIVKVDGGDFEDISFDITLPDPVEALAAWGRVWYVASDRQTIYWSDLLIENKLTGGSSGLLNMYTVWANGTDEIVALREFNNALVIFGKKQIVIYTGAEDPINDLALVDIIDNLGCMARDSVQNVGNDVLFLSDEGIFSLARNIQASGNVKSLPLANLADNASQFLALFSLGENTNLIKSAYKADEGFYLIIFPTSKVAFYLNLKYQTPDNKARVFVWYDMEPSAIASTRDDLLLVGKEGLIGRYEGHRDNGQPYLFQMKSGWATGGEEASSIRKIYKQAIVTFRGGFGARVTFDWSYDFLPTVFDSKNEPIDSTLSPFEYGIAEYGESEYSRVNPVSTMSYNMSGSGKAVQIGFESVVDGSPLDVQKADIYVKSGQIARRGQ